MLTVDHILEEVSNVFGCPVELILSKLRSERELDARQAAIYLLKTETYSTNSEISVLFGYKRKNSVCKVKKQAEGKLAYDSGYRRKVTKVRTELTKIKLGLRI